MKELGSILENLNGLPGETAVLATLVRIEGSSYRRPGARMLLMNGRTRIGSISGGCLEEDIAERARRVMEGGTAELAIYDTTNENDLVWGVGTGCRGIVHVLIEPIGAKRPAWVGTLSDNLRHRVNTGLCVGFSPEAGFLGTRLMAELASVPQDGAFNQIVEPPPCLTLFGAGEDARPLSRMAKELGWYVTVVDSRGALATRERFPEADSVVVAPCGSLDEHVELDAHSYVVVMTHRYEDDLRLLQVLLSRPPAYVGVVGSRQRTERILEHLQEQDAVGSDALAVLSAPVGLDIGASSPEEIALSIVAEVQCVMTGKGAARLRDRKAPIHARAA
ncbi:MAG TPA: XdhC/CoxI family protein [Opitutaceae bacterium]|jgi:xanthine/CO dehydrogenase XdhC/CoxF family maturation factor|nr:XdhC/CoxI family protein [Opitutaceae bacterium]